MNLDNLSKKIRRELARSPKKSAALAVMTLVAVYFWVPIIGGWLKKEETAPTPPPTAPEQSVAATSSQPQQQSTQRYQWHQIEEWMQADPARKPGELLVDSRHPFVDLVELARLEEQEHAKTERSQSELAVENLKLTLTNTIVGGRARRATINGILYAEGDKLRVNPNAQSKELIETDIVIEAIHKSQVILSQEDYKHTVSLSHVTLATGDQIIPSSQHTRK